MKTIIILPILATLYAPYNGPTEYDIFTDYVIKACTKSRIEGKFIARYIEVIYHRARQYGLDPLLIAKQINVESHFCWWRFTAVAYGPMMVSPRYWSHVLYLVDSGKLGKHLLKQDKPDYRKYLKRIDYNIEAGCYIMSNLYAKYGNYKIALLRYAYKNKAFKKHCKKPNEAQYIKKIYGENK
jgi:soluble lytic murein transglycosylase-like protein